MREVTAISAAPAAVLVISTARNIARNSMRSLPLTARWPACPQLTALAKLAVKNMTKLAPRHGMPQCNGDQARRSPRGQSSEHQRVHAHDLRQGTNFLQNVLAHGLIDRHHANRIAAGLVAPQVECRDVEPGRSHQHAEITDKAWLIKIADEQHAWRQFKLHVDVAHLDDA